MKNIGIIKIKEKDKYVFAGTHSYTLTHSIYFVGPC